MGSKQAYWNGKTMNVEHHSSVQGTRDRYTMEKMDRYSKCTSEMGMYSITRNY